MFLAWHGHLASYEAYDWGEFTETTRCIPTSELDFKSHGVGLLLWFLLTIVDVGDGGRILYFMDDTRKLSGGCKTSGNTVLRYDYIPHDRYTSSPIYLSVRSFPSTKMDHYHLKYLCLASWIVTVENRPIIARLGVL